MTEKELEKACEWVANNVARYIGWDQWGCLRIVNPDRFKDAMKKALENHDNH